MRPIFPLISLVVAAIVPPTAFAQTSPDAWAQVPGILARIVPPTFPARDFVITNFGATGDGTTDCTTSFSNAIATCSASGGGRVVVPPGTFITGAIQLLNNVNLFIATNAIIKFSTDTNAYLPLVLTRYQGVEIMNFSPFIYAFQQTNIAITGNGTIDGQANLAAAPWYAWKNLAGAAADEQLMWDMASNNVPVAQRIFGPGHFVRTYFVQPFRCRNVLIEGITIINSPMWVVSPCYCTNVTVRGLTIVNTGANTDGCDPDSCTDFLIKNCSFSEGDDCIAIKSGRDYDGLRVNIPSQNLVIQNCVFANGHGGITFGSEESGGITNVFAENCVMNSSGLNIALRFKNNTARGGYIQNIYVRNCICKRAAAGSTAIHMTMSYSSSSPANSGTNTPLIRNIDIRDCVFNNVSQAVSLSGQSGANPVSDVTIANCRFSNTTTANSYSSTNRITFLNNKGGGF